MDKEKFENNLLEATKIVIPFSQKYLWDVLPEEHMYLVFPNQSYDGNPLKNDEQLFPEDSLCSAICPTPKNTKEVVNYLWRNGKIPEWINVSVHSYDEAYTYLELICCGRFTADDSLLYHFYEGYMPFHVLGPALPPGWENLETNGRFFLNWREIINGVNQK